MMMQLAKTIMKIYILWGLTCASDFDVVLILDVWFEIHEYERKKVGKMTKLASEKWAVQSGVKYSSNKKT